MAVDTAYIIRVYGHEVSMQKADQCAGSCSEVGMKFEFWDAYDGTGNTIVAPRESQFMSLLKLTDHYLTKSEIACALSHISLWLHCVEIDKPIVILEHDAVMLSPYVYHNVYNSICYLGNREQVHQGWKVLPTPPHATEGVNYHFICRAHAYAVDPAVAKNMLAYVLQHGICKSLDMMLRADIFPIHQWGLYAYDNFDGTTTITGRSTEGRTVVRNDNLEN